MFGLTIKEKINNWSDKEVLEHVADLIQDKKITAGVRFIESPDDPLIVGYQSVIVCGDLMLPAEPVIFDWPMQYLPVPEAFKDENPERIN